MKIKDILTIDLTEDIKHVIDLEDLSEAEIQSEIENYIITDGLAKDYSDFVETYTSNTLETGVWISGFYGSGKSYFAKLLGYMLSNRNIGGTPARERIKQRFTGINDESIIINSINKLDYVNSRVVFFDAAKQDTSKGLAFTLFRNFLKTLELPDNEHGFLLFQLMINESKYQINDFVHTKINKNWNEIKTRMLEYAKYAKEMYLINGNSVDDYNNIMTTIRNDMQEFSASRLREELNNYLNVNKNERIVFIFDETSEAIYQKKFNLLDLEGISESLSALGGKVWTIAIAQEKLDEVINNSNVSKAQLTKVTDRFKTKIHLEATEVDVIIRQRLLNKKDNVIKLLKEHYQNNSGKITDHSSLVAAGITKTDNVDSYVTYYPFYNYHFNLMQNFLFGTKGYASTKVAARGMIITTYDILKRELMNQELFDTVTGWQITKQAQPQPNVRLVNRYDNAERILKESNSSIQGRKLLENINFLAESEVVPTTLPNIVRSYINNPDDYHKIQDEISKALDILVEAKILLYSNNTYRITSDIEQRLLEEMNGYSVQGFIKKKQLVKKYQDAQIIKNLSRITEDSLNYDYYITTDNDDELTNPSLKYLKMKIKSIYNISDNRTSDIESIKTQYQNDKDLILIVPDNSSFSEIDKLIDEIERISYLEQKYTNPHSEEVKILQSFTTAKNEKENSLKDIIEKSIQNGTMIYLFNTWQLNKIDWLSLIQKQQREVIKNVYSKRLSAQLSDSLASSIIKEALDTKLQSYFNGLEFQFFDSEGNFIGDNLKVVDEIITKIKNTFIDGGTLEKSLEQPPTGFKFGTVISTVAALMRAGKVIAKHNGSEKYSWRDEGVKDIFNTATTFRRASFKAISKTLLAQQKNEIVTILRELECEKYITKNIDWNTNDFELVNAIKDLSKYFCNSVDIMQRQNKDFNTLFPSIINQKNYLYNFTSTVSESNYIDKAEELLNDKDNYINAILTILKVEKFIRNNLPKLLQWKNFVIGVNDELTKSAKDNEIINNLVQEFNELFDQGIVDNYSTLQQKVQMIKDEYFKLMEDSVRIMTSKYTHLKNDAEALINEINSLPVGLNDKNLSDTQNLLNYANQRIINNVELDFDIRDKQSRFSYSEILSSIDIYDNKRANLEIIKAGLIKESTKETPSNEGNNNKPKKITTKLPAPRLKVNEYKKWLHGEIQKLSTLNDDDEVEIKE